LLVAWSTQTEVECLSSTDQFATAGTDRDDVFETGNQEDHCLLFPANVDDGDCVALFMDRSANEVTAKMYDDSANTFSDETASIVALTDDINWPQMDGSVRHSDGFIVCASHSDADSTGDDILTFTIDPDSITTPTTATTANVVTNMAESARIAVFVNQQNDDVYVTYLNGGTWTGSVDAVYHLSTDDMASWGTEQAYSAASASDFRLVQSGRTVGNNGGFFQPIFYLDAGPNRSVFVNVDNDVAIAAVVAGAAPPPRHPLQHIMNLHHLGR